MQFNWHNLLQGALPMAMLFTSLVPRWVGADDIFKSLGASPEVIKFVDRILVTQNNQALPFVVLDKTHTQVFVFDAKGHLRGTAPALIGLSVGDDAVPGIGHRQLSSILLEEKTTPAGRFTASLDFNLSGNQILWVDYETAISLHPVLSNDRKERRTERLASQSTEDNRISYGCINVSAAFFQKIVVPTFNGTYGIVYILPDSHAINEVFSFYEP
jgi:hypothetical protein